MDLTHDQQRSARACGIAFFPATAAQVQRLTMQRRIFWLGGQPFLATRDGGYWETHSTLLRHMEQMEPSALQMATEEPAHPPRPEHATISDPASTPPAPKVVEPPGAGAIPQETVRVQAKTTRRSRANAEVDTRHDGRELAGGVTDMPVAESPGSEAVQKEVVRVQARTARRRTNIEVDARHGAEESPAGAPNTPTAEHLADAPNVAKTVAEAAAEAVDEQPGRASRRGVRQPKAPRWATAGKERRGRLK